MRNHDNPTLRVWANTASIFLMLGCGMFLVWFLTRRLGVVAYGEYSSLVALALWCRFPVEVLLQSSIIPLVAASKTPERIAASYMRSILLFASLSAVAAMAIGCFLSRWTSFINTSIWIPLCLDVFAQSAANGYLAILAGKGKFFASSTLFGGYWIVRTVMSVLLVEAGFGVLGVAMALPIASATHLFACATVDRFRSLRSQGGAWATIRGESSSFGVNVGLERLSHTMDLVLMNFFGADARAIGYYAAAINLSGVLLAISGASGGIYFQSMTLAYTKRETERLARLSKSLIQGRMLLVGLSILAIPFLPFGTRFIFGDQFDSIQFVLLPLLTAASLRVLLSVGRILNRVSGEPPQIRVALIGLILLNAAGLAVVIFQSPPETALGSNDVLWQAAGCAMVQLLGLFPLTVYSLRLGLIRSEQAFPWISAVRILAIGSILACVATLLPTQGSSGIAVAIALGIVYLGLLNLFGDLVLPWPRKRISDGGSK